MHLGENGRLCAEVYILFSSLVEGNKTLKGGLGGKAGRGEGGIWGIVEFFHNKTA